MKDTRRGTSGPRRKARMHAPEPMKPLVLVCAFLAIGIGLGVALGTAAGLAPPSQAAERSPGSTAGSESGGNAGGNAAPKARDDRYETREDRSLSVKSPGLLRNDDGKNLSAHRVSGPRHGRLDLDRDGSFRYTPDENYHGKDSFSYEARNGKDDRATVYISVRSANDVPNARNNSFKVREDGMLGVEAPGVLRNDSDEDRNRLFASGVSGPGDGTLDLDRDGSFSYSPDADFNGGDSFIYRATDGKGGADRAKASVEVAPVNDAPAFTKGPDQVVNEDAGPQSVTAWATNISPGPSNESNQNVEFDVTDNTNEDLFTSGPAVSPNGTLTYTPADDENGQADVTVRLQDDGGTDKGGDDTSGGQQFKITVDPVNDGPSLSIINDGPVNEGESAKITATATDEEGDAVTYSFDCDDDGTYEVGPQNGNTTDCSFDDNGAREVNVRADDGKGGQTTESTTVTVNNVAPTATLRNTGPVNEGSPVEVSFEDTDGRSTVSDPSGADENAGFRYEYACDGSFEGDPAPNYETASNEPTSSCTFDQNGPETIAARIIDKDGGATTYTTDVTIENVKPSVTLSGPNQVEESTTVERTYEFTVTDPGDDTFTVSTGFPKCGTNGTLVEDSLVTDADGGSFKCIFPDGDATSNVEIQVTDSDGATDTDNRRVVVTVNNAAPTVTIEGDATALEGQTKTYTYTVSDLGNDPNPTVSEGCGAADYTDTPAENSFDCTFPDGDGAGGTTYEVKVTADDGEDVGTGTKNVVVGNVVPEVTGAASQTADEGAGKTFDLGSFTDPGTDGPWAVTVDWGDGSTDTTFASPSPGDIADQNHTYADDDSYTITVTVAEAGQDAPSDEATSNVNVANVAPVADDQDNVTTDEGMAKTITLTASDVDDDPLTFRITSLPTSGTLYDGSGTDSEDEITQDDLNKDLIGNQVTYQPDDPAFFGSDSFDFTACDDANSPACDADGATVSITVSQFNDPPEATDDTKITDEDTPFVFPASDLTANDSAGPNEGDQTLTVTEVKNAVNGTVSLANGQITFTPTANFDGVASFEYTVEDNGKTNGADDFKTDDGKVDVTVTGANDNPTANTDSFTTDEDVALRIAPSELLSNDTDVDGDTLTISNTSDVTNGTLSTDSGNIVFTPTANYNGPASFRYTVSDGNGGSSTATVNITVNPVNDPSELTADTQTIDEDNDATGNVLTNDSDVDNTLSVDSFEVEGVTGTFDAGDTADIPDVGTIAIGSNGDYTFTPDANYNGPVPTVTYTVNTGSSSTLDITVDPVNDPPVANDDSLATDEDVALTIAPDDLTANDTDADGDSLMITSVSNVTNGTVSQQSGNIVFTPTANYNGPASFDYTLSDGSGETSTATVNITVRSVNDPPEATDDTLTLDEDTPTVFDPRTNDSKGPANESGQTLAVSATFTNGPNNGTATVITSGNDAGKVRFAPNANYSGSDSFTYEVCDNGTTNGVADPECDTATVSVTVTPVNDAPVADDENFSGTFRAVGNTALVANDSDDGAPDPTGPQKTIQGDILAGDNDPDSNTLAVTARTFDTNDGGRVELQADGDFTFYPKAGTSCTDKSDYFDYTVTDQNTSVKPGTAGTDTGRVTIAIEDCVWYVDDNAATNGDGRSHTPFKTLAGVNGANDADAPGQTIFLYAPLVTYVGNLALENDQTLFTQAHGLRVPDGSGQSNSNVELVSGSPQSLVRFGGLTLASNNTAQGVSPVAPSGTALSGNSVGNATINTVTGGLIRNESGKAVDISGGNLNMVFSSVTAINSTNDGVRLDNVSGTFTANGGEITNASEQDIDITGDRLGDTLDFTYKGTITDDTGTLVNVSGQNGGTKDFDGAISDGNDGDGNGITLSNNTGATTRFDGGLTLSTGANPAFTATGGGTVVATDPANGDNTITTTTGTALNVANTNIGSDKLTFRSVSANGAPNAVVLNNTGTSGGLVVTGSGNNTQGGDNSGGTIQNTTGVGISLTSTTSPSFNNMNIQNTEASGINGTQVTNFTFTNGTINGAGNGSDEGSISLDSSLTNTNVSGTVTITNNELTASDASGVDIQNNTGTLDHVNISNNMLSGDGLGPVPGSAAKVIGLSAAADTTRITITNNTLTEFNESGFVLQANGGDIGIVGSATNRVLVTGNVIDGANPPGGVGNQTDSFVVANVGGGGATSGGQGNFDISNNGTAAAPIKNIDGIVISVTADGISNATATINNNFIRANNAVGSAGIAPGADFAATLTATVSNNNIGMTDGQGIFSNIRNGATGRLNITNNIVAAPTPTTIARAGIQVSSGSSGTSDANVCMDVSGNTTAGSTNSATGTIAPGISLRKDSADGNEDVFGVEGMAATSSPGVEQYVGNAPGGKNPLSANGTFGNNGVALPAASTGFSNCSTAP